VHGARLASGVATDVRPVFHEILNMLTGDVGQQMRKRQWWKTMVLAFRIYILSEPSFKE
jgi:hypothetical protein